MHVRVFVCVCVCVHVYMRVYVLRGVARRTTRGFLKSHDHGHMVYKKVVSWTHCTNKGATPLVLACMHVDFMEVEVCFRGIQCI